MNLGHSQYIQRNFPEQKQFQLIQDLKILSSLKGKNLIVPNNINNQNLHVTSTSFANPNRETTNTFHISSPQIQPPFISQFTVDSIPFFNNNTTNNNNITNLSYYQDPFFLDNNKQVSLLSINSIGNKEGKLTTESYLKNFVPFNQFTNLSYRIDKNNNIDQQHNTREIQIYKQDDNNWKNEEDKEENNKNKKTNEKNNIKKITNKKKEKKEENEQNFLGKKKKLFLNFKNKKRKKNKAVNNIIDINNLKNKITFNEENKGVICEHTGCKIVYKTKKQKYSHHHKMNIECKRDTVRLLDLIKNTKLIILDYPCFRNVNLNKLKDKYNNVMKGLSLQDHVQLITGYNFNDIFKD